MQYFEVRVKVHYEAEGKGDKTVLKSRMEKYLIKRKSIIDVAAIVKPYIKALYNDFEIVSIREYDIVDIIDETVIQEEDNTESEE